MILQLWIAAALLLVIACTIFLSPFLGVRKMVNKVESQATRNHLNREQYKVRIAELERDEEKGLILDKAKIITELQHNLLDDTVQILPQKTVKEKNWLWLPGVLVLILGSIGLYRSVGGYQQLGGWEKALQRYPALQSKLFNETSGQPNEQDLRDMMLGLRTQLNKQADDAQGWLLYGRLSMLFQQPEQAIAAVSKAYQLAPMNNDIRLVYIQLQMQRGDQQSQQQAEKILINLLEEQPELLDAWSMYAFMALEKQDFRAAIARWKKMLPLIDETSTEAKIVRDSIAYAKNQLSDLAMPEASLKIINNE